MSEDRDTDTVIRALCEAIRNRDEAITNLGETCRRAVQIEERIGEEMDELRKDSSLLRKEIDRINAANFAMLAERDATIERLKKQIDGMAASPQIEIVPSGTCAECLSPAPEGFRVCNACYARCDDWCNPSLRAGVCDRIKGHTGPCRGRSS